MITTINEFITTMNEKQALFLNKIDNVNRLINSGNVKELLKELNKLIKESKIILRNININDINVISHTYKNIDVILIKFKLNIETIFEKIFEICNALDKLTNKEDEHVMKYFGYSDTRYQSLQVEINKDKLNQFDIINNLPEFLQGIGLGTKIYKAIIKKYKYIFSNGKNKPSVKSSMVFLSLAKDEEIYTFINGSNILCFDKDNTFENILNVLKKFYKTKQDILEIDDTFLSMFNISEEEVRNILKITR